MGHGRGVSGDGTVDSVDRPMSLPRAGVLSRDASSKECGIRYERPESRVCRIAHLQGVPVHPTPLYSMLGNVAIGLVVGRMWMLEHHCH